MKHSLFLLLFTSAAISCSGSKVHKLVRPLVSHAQFLALEKMSTTQLKAELEKSDNKLHSILNYAQFHTEFHTKFPLAKPTMKAMRNNALKESYKIDLMKRIIVHKTKTENKK